jgi:hypothetical protein
MDPRHLYSKLLAAREEEDIYGYSRQLLNNELKIAIGTFDALDGIATWRRQTVERLDQTALKAAAPEIFQRYVRAS